jgi:hypothetical protein
MLDWTNEDPRLTPETQQTLSKLPLTKAFLGPSLDTIIWLADINPELKNIRSRFKRNEKTYYAYYAVNETLAFFALNSRIVNPSLSDEEIRTGQEILLALGFEAFLQKVDREKYDPIHTLIISKLREIELINKDVLMQKKEEILDWYFASWKIGYHLLPSIIGQSPSEDREIDQPPKPDKSPGSGDLDLGPFADFINNNLLDL